MRAIVLKAFGPAENLEWAEVPDPEPGPGQVRIAVRAAGVHLIDTSLREGKSFGFPLPDLPSVPGREVAGVVDAAGPEVPESLVGQRVVAHLGFAAGGYAELAIAPLEAVKPIPDGLSDEVAVAMIGTGRTAVGILGAAAITADDVVLVTAAAGGLGALFVQAALDAGALVAGLAGGAAKVETVRGLGATAAIDYTEPGWDGRVVADLGGRAPTVALDGVGGPVGRAAMKLLAPGGRLLMFGWSSGEELPLTAGDLWAGHLTVSVPLGPPMMERMGGIRRLEELSLEAAATGRLTPLVTTFPLAGAAAAHRALEGRGTVGKVVLLADG